jgi:hypothetical protein
MMKKRNVYELVYFSELEPGQTWYQSIWVFTQKFKDGKWVVKARLVANGSKMEKGYVYSPTVERMTLFTLLTLAGTRGWPVRQADFKSAFLNGRRSEPVYVKCNYISKCVLLKVTGNLYGFPDSPLIWQKDLQGVLAKLDFFPCIAEKGLYVYQGSDKVVAFVGVYVDDLLLVASDEPWLDDFVERLG